MHLCKVPSPQKTRCPYTGMRRITTFRSTTDRIHILCYVMLRYIILYYIILYYIILYYIFLTYLHTPWNRVLLEKLTGLQLVKKFPAFYETRRFITATCPYPEPARSIPYPRIPLPEDPSIII